MKVFNINITRDGVGGGGGGLNPREVGLITRMYICVFFVYR